MRTIVWTPRAIQDVQAIRTFIAQESQHYAEVVVQRILAAVERVPRFPESGRIVPELNEPTVREVIHPPYRIVYRVLQTEIHIITVHHAARMFNIPA